MIESANLCLLQSSVGENYKFEYNFPYIQVCPENEDYKLYYAQSLQKSCQYEAAMKASFTIENPDLKESVAKLQVKSDLMELLINLQINFGGSRTEL